MNEIYQRVCPNTECGEIIYYSNKNSLKKASNKNSLCIECRNYLNSESHKGHQHSQATKDKMSASRKGRYMSDAHKNQFNNLHKRSIGRALSLEHRQKLSDLKKGKHLSEEHKQKISEAAKRNMTEEKRLFLSKISKQAFHNGSIYNPKEYTLPNGRIVNIQGYEPWTLDKMFSDNSIQCDTILIGKDMFMVEYEFEGKLHNYLPDLYDKTTNTIIETKSIFTLKKHIEKDKAKWKAAVDAGYNMRIIVWDNKHNLYKDKTIQTTKEKPY